MNGQLAEAPKMAAPLAIRQMLHDCEQIGNAAPDDAQSIGSLLQKMILNYYADVRRQAQQSFLAALVVACIGILFFIYAIWLGMSSDGILQASIGVIAGTLIQVISGINFYLYARASRQFGAFHVCLERTNRFILANCMCEKLSLPARDEMRVELARLVATAPMLTLDMSTGVATPSSTRTKPPRKPVQTTSSAGTSP
jgi:hypothetical protein